MKKKVICSVLLGLMVSGQLVGADYINHALLSGRSDEFWNEPAKQRKHDDNTNAGKANEPQVKNLTEISGIDVFKQQ